MSFNNQVLEDDLDLLTSMVNEMGKQQEHYHPGPYWKNKTKVSVNALKKFGLTGFRGFVNPVGQSYTDNILTDVSTTYCRNFLHKLYGYLFQIFPFNTFYNSQTKLTKNYASRFINYSQQLISKDRRIPFLLEKYIMPYSLLGESVYNLHYENTEYSIHYLNLLEQHDNISSHIDFTKTSTIFEIGGGFGCNIHLLIENYPNIRKVIYLDIPPNLYVGTQYLKAFYDSSVIDYNHLRNSQSIQFSSNDDLEILCIPPWLIERLDCNIDVFINSHSFVEMPIEVVNNYITHIMKLPESQFTSFILISYDNFDLKTTLDPKRLPQLFVDQEFIDFTSPSLIDPTRKNLYFISTGS